MKKIFVITGINVLTGKREELSLPMDLDHAQMRLARELDARKYKHHLTHKRLRVDVKYPQQLRIKFY